MRQVIDRRTPLVADPARRADVTALGVDETSYLRATAAHATTFATEDHPEGAERRAE